MHSFNIFHTTTAYSPISDCTNRQSHQHEAVALLNKSESEKMKMFTGDNLKKEIESAEERLNLFWSGKMERLGAAHAVKVEKMEKVTLQWVAVVKDAACLVSL